MKITTTKLTYSNTKKNHRTSSDKTVTDSQKTPKDEFRKVSGSIGALTGSVAGRALTPASLAYLGGTAGSRFGTLGTAVGGLLGLAAGIKLEAKTNVGRVLGGMVGGLTGYTLGAAADLLGAKPSEGLAQECEGFSLKELPKRLANPQYTSHKRLSSEIAAVGVKHLKPGDLIMTNDDASMKLEFMQKATGGNANWTHSYLVDNDGTVMDILIGNGGPTRWPAEHAFTDNCHAQVLRPKYDGPESVEKTLQAARDGFGSITYDDKFSLDSDDKQYCQEYIFKAMQKGSPEVKIEPRSVLGKELVTAEEFQASSDFEEVWSTGSNFWTNWLSHFN